LAAVVPVAGLAMLSLHWPPLNWGSLVGLAVLFSSLFVMLEVFALVPGVVLRSWRDSMVGAGLGTPAFDDKEVHSRAGNY
jgi:hypothetical protein